MESLKRTIDVFSPGVIMLQETKLKKQGKTKLEGYTIFEKYRQNFNGGGLMSAVHVNLKPVAISDENPEFLVVDITGNFGTIRTINCYGPQENSNIEVRNDFFIELEKRIVSAKSELKMICIECDANSKLGNSWITGDPHDISENGKLMAEIISRQHLIVVNATEKCQGVITRYKKTINGEEKSVIDYFIVCQELFQNVVKMNIDEERQYTLSRFYKYKSKSSVVKSDHNLMTLTLSFKWSRKQKLDRKEIYNLRNPENQKIFYENTINNQRFYEALSGHDIITGGKKWIKEVQHIISKSFKKVRISPGNPKLNPKLNELFQKREKLQLEITILGDQEQSLLKEKLKELNDEIADIEAEDNYKIVHENVKHLVDDTENLNAIKMWKLRKKICPKKVEPPTAKLSESGEIISEPTKLKKLYEHTYKKRLEHRKMKPELINLFNLKMYLFNLRLEVTKKIKSKKWSEEDLLKVLKTLKKNKSADSHGLIYELFRPEIIGKDLLYTLLMLCNNVKAELTIPEFMTFTDITSFYKNKGARNDLENDRGVFTVSKIRSIIEKLVMFDSYETIDLNMSDSNVGGRRRRNIRDNLFVIYACINEAIRNKKDIDLQFYDIQKCFDAMWTQETMNDVYDAGIKDDRFYLISKMNEKCQVKVKTPVGDTDRFQLNDIEMQGTVPAPLKCSVQMDTIGRYSYTYNTGLYHYRDACCIPALGMIDDISGVSECNSDSIILNSIINSKVESKKLEFNWKKCVNIHVGPNKKNCSKLMIHEKQMLTSKTQSYLGDMISDTGCNDENIKTRCQIGQATISEIESMLNDGNFGKFTIQTGLTLRDTNFTSKVLLNSEVWHSLTKSQISSLEIIDRRLMRKFFDAHSKTSLEWLYSDAGKLDIKSLIKIRRLMYLWEILHRDKSELIYRVYRAQRVSNNIGDWVRLIDQDKSELKITLTDEQIQGVSKQSFKTYVKKQVTQNFLQNLEDKKMKHSKLKFMNTKELKTAEYIKSPVFSTREKRLLFKLRSRTLDVKCNFPGKYGDLLCISCGLYQETQFHLLQCPEINKELQYLNLQLSTVTENFVYGTIKEQQIIVNLYSDILEVREKLKQQKIELPSIEGPVHLDTSSVATLL